MSTATLKDAPTLMPVNNELLAAAVSAAESAFSMCGVTTRCVGASAVPVRDSGMITGLIGVHGKVSGFISVNFPERAAVHAVSSLLGEKFTALNAQVVDGVGEITNMITGGIKSALADTKWAFSQITVPSVIVGRGYSIAYAKGLTFLSITFEHDDSEAMLLEDRLIQIHISLLTL
jgi:chemotaxis protein CheX